MTGSLNFAPRITVLVLSLRVAAAVRAWDEAEVQPVLQEVQECGHWGDTFQEAQQIFLWFDLAWFSLAALVAAGLLLWTPPWLCVDSAVSQGEDKSHPIAWYKAAFQSLTSHAAGIVGFVGFNHLVVARVLMLSEPCNFFSLCNCLLYITLALSVVAVMSSCVFLVVDYLRRLAIDSARQKGFRLTLKPHALEDTGLGKALLLLAAVMLILFAARIGVEARRGPAEEESSEMISFLLTCAGGCATVSLFYVNLRALHQSPKVHFDTTSFVSKEDTELASFLKQEARGTWLPDWAAKFLRGFGGEDLALLAEHGSRQTFFPQNRLAPLLHVVIGLMIIGLFPLGVQAVMERLFVAPKLKGVKELTGDWAEVSERPKLSMWQSLGLGRIGGHSRHFLLIPASDAGQLQVTAEFRKTLSVKLCCSPGTCIEEPLRHSLTKFHSKPLILPLGNASACNLSLLGLSKRSVTEVSLTVVSKKKYHFGNCYRQQCTCAEGYEGLWDFSEWSNATLARLNSTPCGRCLDGEIGPPPNCKPAACDVLNSNHLDGQNCSCSDGFSGNISWRGASPVGQCQPAECNVEGSNQRNGWRCRCADGFNGSIIWNGSQAEGQCLPAPCNIEGSNRANGSSCRCADGFAGDITWDGAVPQGTCAAARCRVENSNQEPGWGCKCIGKYVGNISWSGSEATGDCQPAECIGERVNGEPGRDCACKEGYIGEPILVGDHLTDSECREAPCKIANSTGQGAKCQCRDGFEGEIFWKGAKAAGSCQPAPCMVQNSNQLPGRQCKCLEHFAGRISWHGSNATGECSPMPCYGKNVNEQPGPGCACLNGYGGKIHARHSQYGFESVQKGDCKPVSCDIKNSNHKRGPACRCATGFRGEISWNGSIPQGTCKPVECDIEDAHYGSGSNCQCKPGFQGEINWLSQESRWSGACRALSCTGPHVNYVDGPKCDCADGFIGNVTEDWYDWTGVGDAWDKILRGHCEPADCEIDNSNKAAGTNCSCLDGYSGIILWNGPLAQGSCIPAPCNIHHSNRDHGLACRCKDGFDGEISWSGSQPSGKCTRVPCSIPDSDFAPGPDCKCLSRFYGEIKWNGTQVAGQCLPKPVCSNITHVTWLQKSLKDSEGQLCEAGQQVVVRGMPGEKAALGTGIRWTTLQSHLPGRCTWNISERDELELESVVSGPLPKICSEWMPIPRCAAEVQYRVTTSKPVGCGDQSLQLLQFEGRHCGYDLLKWERVRVLDSSGNASAPCKILEEGKPLACGETPTNPPLPGECILTGLPALFDMFEFPGSWWIGSIKLFDIGVCTVQGSTGVEVFHNCWKTDRTHVHFEAPLSNLVPTFNEQDALFRKPPGNRKGSELVHPSEKFVFKAVGKLPYWWMAKFREADENIFSADTLYGCLVARYVNGTCYRAMIGNWVDIFRSTQKECSHSWKVQTKHEYNYAFTQGITQNYVSKEPCLPFSNHHELELDIIDLRSEGNQTDEKKVGTMETTCRSYLRFVVDTARCSEHFNFFEAWRQERMTLNKSEQLST